MPVTFAVMSGGFTLREKLFFAIAWSPKARPRARLPPCQRPPCLRPRRLRPARRAPRRRPWPAARPPARRPRALNAARATNDTEAARRLSLVCAGRAARRAARR